LGAIRGAGNSKDMMDVSNLEEYQFDDSATVRFSSHVAGLFLTLHMQDHSRFHPNILVF
jgi:hypothetical protein